jgi:hypothetical protein
VGTILIVVLTEFGGERLLGKAREIADSLGLRVVAVCSSRYKSSEFLQKLISLGADEVLKYSDPSNVFEWSEALSSLLVSRKQVKFLLATSGIISDAILGRVYALNRDRVSTFASGVTTLSDTDVTKNLKSWGVSLRFKIAEGEEKTCIFSYKPFSVPKPFEDSSRYGKIGEEKIGFASSTEDSPKTSNLKGQDYSSSSILTILVGKRFDSNRPERELVQRVASNYNGNLLTISPKVQDIYGPCLAIGLEGWQDKDLLPRFHEELISIIDSQGQSISTIADTSIVTDNVPEILKNL